MLAPDYGLQHLILLTDLTFIVLTFNVPLYSIHCPGILTSYLFELFIPLRVETLPGLRTQDPPLPPPST